MIFNLFGYSIRIDKIKKLPYRRSGRTTRLADGYIQDLFTEGKVKIVDHHSTTESSRLLADIVVHRLIKEHSINKDFIKRYNSGGGVKLEILMYKQHSL